MNLTDFIEKMFLPMFKRAEAAGNTAECLRLLIVLGNAIEDAKKEVS
jgi:hypothetical protein